jgi:hypothetical protein
MEFLTLPQLAARSGWPESRIRRMVAQQKLPHIRLNSRVLLPPTAIDDFINRNCIQPVGQPSENAASR